MPKDKTTLTLENSLRRWDTRLALNPDDAHALKVRGAIKRMLKDCKGALEDLNASLQLEPNDASALKIRGATKIVFYSFKGALKDLNASLRFKPDDAFALKHRGIAKKMLNDYKGALKDLNASLRLEPDDAYARKICNTVEKVLNDDKEACENLNALRVEPKALLRRGVARRMLKDYKGADEDINNSLRQRHKLFVQQMTQLKQGRTSHSMEIEEIVRQDAKLEPWALELKCAEFFIDQGNFHKTFAQNSSSASQKEALYTQALQSFSKALDCDPDSDSEVASKVSQIQAQLNKQQSAAQAIGQYGFHRQQIPSQAEPSQKRKRASEETDSDAANVKRR